MPSVPSGSALHSVDGLLYVISDDAPFIYRCTPEGSLVDSVPLAFLGTTFHRIPKAHKPDFEASVIGRIRGRDCIFAFGSGSVETVRDSGIVVQLANIEDQQHFSLSPFYAHIRSTLGIAVKDFNIEGAALRDDKLILFNRGTNHLIQTSLAGLVQHVLEGSPPPSVTGQIIELAKTGPYITGISGADFIDDTHLLFCASVEATQDWFADGEVLGSYVGVIELREAELPKVLEFLPLLDGAGSRAKEKLESIALKDSAWIKGEKFKPRLIGLVDNDDGTSKLLHIDVK